MTIKKQDKITNRSQDEEMVNEGGGQAAVADRPRGDSLIDEPVLHSSAGGLDLARGWVGSLSGVILVALAIVETVLAGRLGFLLASANSNNGFVDFIYDVSKPLAEPFQGIVANSGNLEYASAIAMGVYAVAALLLIAALFALAGGPPSGDDSVVSSSSRPSERVIR